MARARNLPTQLWLDHERLVYQWVNSYVRKCPCASPEELLGQGRLAFAEAVSSWDPTRGMFSTHLVWQLRNRLSGYVKQELRWTRDHDVRAPVGEPAVDGPLLDAAVPAQGWLTRFLEGLTPRGRKAVAQALRSESVAGVDLRAREEVRRALRATAFA